MLGNGEECAADVDLRMGSHGARLEQLKSLVVKLTPEELVAFLNWLLEIKR
jgi:hypothetical protein